MAERCHDNRNSIKIAIFSVVLNNHQVGVADELYELTGHSFVFVELEKPVGLNNKGGSEDFSSRPYLLQSWRNADSEANAMEIARSAEVVIFGGYMALKYQVERLKKNRLTFEMGERWLKHWQSCFSPRLLKSIWNYHFRGWKNKPLYKLCSSAYCANDQYLFKTFIGRCYKWGYFTKVDSNFEVEATEQGASTSEITPLMWCARFLKWKHPELPVKLAHRLKQKGYKFNIDMFGSGEEYDRTKYLIKKLGVEDCVKLRGNLPNEKILKEMRKHSIFLFTSDRNEGWGAVLNEAMSNGCAVVASDVIGSVPFLVKDGDNGLVFKSENIESLFNKVVFLLQHPSERARMQKEAYITMNEKWTPRQASLNFMLLYRDLIKGRDSSVADGPCSKAEPYYY